MPRFHCDLPLYAGRRVELPPEAARHAIGALRLRDGDTLVLFNGDGGEYPGILELRGKAAFVALAERAEPERESPLDIRLAQGISSGERMDLTLQKAVELGVTGIQPLMLRRTVVRLDGDREDKRLRHWRGVVTAACEQCGRNRLPPVSPIRDGLTWLARDQDGPAGRFILDPEGAVGLDDVAPPAGPVWLLAGPEGGFDPAERQAALAAGFRPLRLGRRILRTETAALAALAAFQARWGDFR
ncbi:MAG: 16S rRNA (uracil(1498)-N(3))-methyltransferase [Pseudomonadota bacterium]